MIRKFCEELKRQLDARAKMAESALNTCGKEAIIGLRSQRTTFLEVKSMIDELYKNFDPDDLDESEER